MRISLGGNLLVFKALSRKVSAETFLSYLLLGHLFIPVVPQILESIIQNTQFFATQFSLLSLYQASSDHLLVFSPAFIHKDVIQAGGSLWSSSLTDTLSLKARDSAYLKNSWIILLLFLFLNLSQVLPHHELYLGHPFLGFL